MKRTIDILTTNPNSSVKQICHLLYGEEVELRSSKYNSMTRSLLILQSKGLIVKGEWSLKRKQELQEILFPEHLKEMWIGLRNLQKEEIQDEIYEAITTITKTMTKLIYYS